jgi:DNA-binding IclR family transcriptional regulator
MTASTWDSAESFAEKNRGAMQKEKTPQTSRPAKDKRVPAVRRAAAILWLLGERSSPMNLSQISRAVSILPSTTLHILRELVSARLIAHDPELKVYRLGQGVVELSQSVIRHDSFAELARPHLQAIASRFGVSTTATSKIDEEHMALVAFVTPPEALSLNLTLGGRVPLFSGAAGRCIAAHSNKSRAQLHKAFTRIKWSAPLRFEEWLSQVERSRKDGYGEDRGYFSLGVTTLAVPIVSSNGSITRVIGTVSITAQLDAVDKAEIVAALKEAALDIGPQLAN